jgi:hypothetical protein
MSRALAQSANVANEAPGRRWNLLGIASSSAAFAVSSGAAFGRWAGLRHDPLPGIFRQTVPTNGKTCSGVSPFGVLTLSRVIRPVWGSPFSHPPPFA